MKTTPCKVCGEPTPFITAQGVLNDVEYVRSILDGVSMQDCVEGVFKRVRGWGVEISMDGHRIHVGTYDTKIEAQRAYTQAITQYLEDI